MEKKTASAIMLTLLLTSMLTLAFNIQPVKASGTIYIRADGSIDPPDAPISTVNNVTYTFTDNIYDSIVVERGNIMVDGAGYTLQGTGSGYGFYWSGINNVTIKDTNIKYFYNGIWLRYSSYNSISGNNIANNRAGIWLHSSNNNSISGNTFFKNGLSVWHSYDNVVVDNLVNGKPLVYLEGVSDYTVDNAGQVVLVNCNNILVENLNLSQTDVGVELWGTNNTKIGGNNITANNEDGIRLYSSNNNSISGNNITANKWCGICLSSSSYNTVANNTASDNGDKGIALGSSNNNMLANNTASNTNYGIELSGSSNNVLVGNTASNNRWSGISLWNSNGSIIYHNNFVDNIGWQAYIPTYPKSYNNTWDDGYPSGGNYWSDYVGVDVKSGLNQDLPGSDCIGDTPYIIDADNQDRYPLMRPWTLMPTVYTFSIVWEEETFTVSVESNSTVSNFAFNQPNKEISFYVTGPDGTIGFSNVTIPKQLLYGEPWSVLIDGISVTPTIAENETHSILYFTYTHSTHKIQIIGTYVIAPPPPPLSVSISPLSASILVGQSVTFTSTVSGGYTPYSYQWYLNSAPVPSATSASWTFTPTASGIYYIHLKVTDAKANTAQSDTARITAATVPVGGYSIPIQVQTKTEPIIPYIALIAALTAIFTKLRPKTKRKH